MAARSISLGLAPKRPAVIGVPGGGSTGGTFPGDPGTGIGGGGPGGPGNPGETVPGTQNQTTSGDIAAEGPISIVNQYSATNNIDTGPIGEAINSGIGNVVDAVNQAQQSVAQTISGTISNAANSLLDWAKSIGAWIAQHISSILQAIGSALKDVASTVINAVKDAVSGAIKALSDTVGPIISEIGQDLKKALKYYNDTIAPVLNSVAKVTQAIRGAIIAIEKDVKSGLQGILQLPGDIANALGQIDQALIRAGLALRVKRKSDADVYFYSDEPGSFAAHIKGLGDSVIGLAPVKEKTTYSPGKEVLGEPTLAQELPALMDSVYTILADVCKGIANLPQDFAGVLEILGIAGAGLAISFVSPFLLVGSALAMVRGPFDVVSELAQQRAYQAAPIRKLEPSILAEAARRGFIDAQTMDAEMAVQGFDAHRSDLLRRLTVFLEPASTLVDYWFRQIVDDKDFSDGLHDLGYTDDQIAALKEGSTRILDVQDIITAWRRNEADVKAVDDTLTANRFTAPQRDLLKALAFAPAGYAESYRHFLTGRFLSDYGYDPNAFPQPPKEVRDGGRADGLSDDAISARWNGTINTLDPGQWLAMYWRGGASLKQLQVALDQARVPDFLQQIWIDSQRPLIPLRTIPSMVKAGILTPAEGLAKLQEHGYSLSDAAKLIQYAGASAKGSKAATASTQHEISIATAKQLYADGAITKDQFSKILVAHGFDPVNVALEIQLTDIVDQAALRRHTGTSIVDEFLAGMLTHDEAVQRLAESGLTQAEQAKYLKSLHASKITKTKLPTESELRAMTVHMVISEDDYTSGLVNLGYSQIWADRFKALHFPVAPSGTTP